MTAPWYVGGLAFECVQCGRCCAGPEEGYVWLTPREADAIAAFLNMPPVQFAGKYVRKVRQRYSLVEDRKSRDCAFLSRTSPEGAAVRKGCSVYAVRPLQCRTWPFWPANLASPQAWALAGARCPGINRGPLFTYDEIEVRLTAAAI